jgi:hypothetical protein
MIAGLFFLRQRIFGNVESAQLKVSTSEMSNSEQCQINVTIDRPQSDVDLSVTVTAQPGIRFMDTGLNTVTREIGTVFPREERILDFNCYLDGTTLHSGAYVVKAVAKYLSPPAREGQNYASGSTPLYVELRPDEENASLVNAFLPGQPEFDALFTEPYEEGAYYQYRLDLADAESKPTSGSLDVRISSSQENFSPALYVVVSGGVGFYEPEFPGFVWYVDVSQARIQAYDIDSGGSRIVTIPFAMIQSAIPGSYGIKVLQAGEGQAPGEMAPLYVGVTFSPESPDQLWLTPDKRDDAPLLTPAPTPRR